MRLSPVPLRSRCFLAALVFTAFVGRVHGVVNCLTPPPGLVSWWKAESNALDQVGGNNGTLFGDATYASGRVGQAFAFDGVGDGVEVGNPANLQLQNFTVETWIKRASTTATSQDGNGNGVIFAYDTGGYGVYLDPSGHPALTKVGVDNVTLGTAITDTNFHHLAVAKGGSTVVFYVDGVSNAVFSYNPGFTFTSPAGIGAIASVHAYTFWGTIDEVSVYNRALSAAEVQAIYSADGAGKCVPAVPPSCVPPPSGLVAWWPFQSNAVDVVGGHNGTLAGTYSFAAGEVGLGLNASGTTAGASVADSPDLDFGPGIDFSIELWVKPVVANTTYGAMGLIDKRQVPNTSQAKGYLLLLGNGELSFQMCDSLAKPVLQTSLAGPDLRDGLWHHVAVTIVRGSTSGGNLYVDGQVVLTFDPTSQQGDLTTTAPVLIGLAPASLGLDTNFRGGLDEASIYRRALTAGEVQAIYTEGAAGKCSLITPPCAPAPAGLVSWWRGEANALDQMGSNNGTLSGGVTFGPGRVGQAFVIDGTGSAVRVGNPANLQVQDLTIETWIKRASTSVASRDGNGNGHICGFQDNGWTLYMDPSGHPSFGKTGISAVSSAAEITDTNFHHVAVTKSGSTVVFYLDGTAYSAPAYDPGFTFSTPVWIGGLANNYNFYGTIDEVSVYSRALSTAEVQAIYNAGTAGKCVTVIAPVITSQPVDQTVVIGGAASFNVVASGTGPLSYQWRRNGVDLAGQTESSLLLINVQSTNAGKYSVLVSNQVDSVLSSNALLIVNPAPPCASQPSGLVSWWKGEGNALDQTGGNNGTLSGSVSFGVGRVGQGFVIDGLGSAVSLGNPANLHIQDLTIEVWIKRGSGSVASQDGNGNGHIFGFEDNGWTLYMDPNGHPAFGKTGISAVSAGAAIIDLNFHHVAVTKSGSTVVFYIDGVPYAAPAYNPGFTFSTPLWIGGIANNYNFYGTIDEVSVYNRALTAGEVQGIYNAGAAGKCVPTPPPTCVPPSSGLVAWWPMQSNAVDVVGGQNGTLSGNYSFVPSEVGLGLSANGGTAGASVPDSSDLDFGPGVDFSIELWVQPRAATTPYGVMGLIDKRAVPNISQAQGYLLLVGDGKLSFQMCDSLSKPFLQTGAVGPDMRDGAWHHAAVTVVRGSTNGGNLYVDGQVVLTFDPTSQQGDLATTAPVLIGLAPASLGLDTNFRGGLDEASIYRRALTAGEIQAIYNAGVAGKCVPVPPPACVAAPSGLIAWWPLSSNVADFGGGHAGLLQGNCSFVHARVDSGLSVIGVPAGVSVADTYDLNIGAGVDFSIEAWIQPLVADTSYGVMDIVDKRVTPNDSQSVGYELAVGNGQLVFQMSESLNTPFLVAGGVGPELRDGAWHHVAVTVTRASSTGGKLYVDGQVVLTFDPTSEQGDLSTTAPLLIGMHPSYPRLDCNFRGIIDEPSIYRRALTAAEVQAIYNAGGAGKCLNPLAPTIVLQPASQTTIAGSGVTFNVVAVGTPTLSYQWQFEGSDITGQTSNSLTLLSVQVTNAGRYSVLVSNLAGPTPSSNAILTVNPPPLCTPAPAGLVSWWKGEGNAFDQTDGNNGTPYGNVTYGPGLVGQGFVFDGQGDGIQVPNPTNLRMQDFTIETWIKRGSTTSTSRDGNGNGHIFGFGTGGYGIYLDPAGHPALTKVGINNVTLSRAITDTSFHHLAVTKAASQVVFYIDGVSNAVFSYNPGFTFTSDVSIGGIAAAHAYTFWGTIDEVSVYNRALSDPEIQAIYNADGSGKCVNRSPVAQCQNMVVAATTNCLGTASVDNGSFDPDGDPITVNQVPPGPYPLGTNAVTLVVADNHGATNTCSALVIVLDQTSPDLTCPGNLVVSNDLNQCGALVNFPLPIATDLCSAVSNVSCIPAPGAFFPVGITTVQCTATDSAGNTGRCSFTVTVRDAQPPTITCPSDILVTNAHNASTSLVTYKSPAVSDNCPGVGQPVCNPPSGLALGVGSHSVNCSVMDAAGNSGSCRFNIVVYPGDVPPVPVIEVSPLAQFPGYTNLIVIAPDGLDASVTFDGSKSYDLDDTNFNYFWYEGTNLLGTNVVMAETLSVGSHEITLLLDDTFPMGTSSASVTVEVITPAQSIGIVMGLVDSSSLARNTKRPLMATLKAAAASFERGDVRPAINQLNAFQNKVRAQVAPFDPVLANELIGATQTIINALGRK